MWRPAGNGVVRQQPEPAVVNGRGLRGRGLTEEVVTEFQRADQRINLGPGVV
jgi:hypothetical protein